MIRLIVWLAFFVLLVPQLAVADVAIESLISECDTLFDRDAPYEKQIAKATEIRDLGVARNDDELIARGSIRMLLIEIHTGKWIEDWESLRDESIRLSAGFNQQSVAKVEVQAFYGFLRALYFAEFKEGIADLRSSIAVALSLELDAFLTRAHYFLGRVAIYDEQELNSLESFRLSIRFAQHSKNEWAEFQALRELMYFSDAFQLDVESELPNRFRELCVQFKRQESISMEDEERRALMQTRIEGFDELRNKTIAEAYEEIKACEEAARFLVWEYSEEGNWIEVGKCLLVYEHLAKLLDNESGEVESKFMRAGMLAREGDLAQAQGILAELDDANPRYYRTPEGCIWMAEQFRTGGDDKQADDWFKGASEIRDHDQITKASALSANAYFDSLMSDRKLRSKIRRQEKTLLNQRWFSFSLALSGICMWLVQQTLQQRGRQKELQGRIDEQTESLRLAKEKAEAQNHAKTEFVARINHEIRNPLTAIVACSELITDPRLSAEDLQGAQDTLRISSDNVLRLINDVIDFSQIESGSLVDCPNSFAPAALLDSVAAMINPKLSAGVELRRITSINLPEFVKADETKMQQVLLNVAQNAVRYTSSGHIELGCQFVPPKTETDTNSLRWVIRDTGSGMSTDQINAVFTQSTDQLTGTGLGLYISKALVDCMQGTIECESQAGRGTTFTVCIPFQVANCTEVTLEPLQSGTGVSRSVLVLDDEPANRTVLEKLLTNIGCECDVADSWPVAKSLLMTKEFDVVLLDLRMPEVDGFEVFRRLTQLPIAYKPRVYAMTGDATEPRRQQVSAAGFVGFLAKPFSIAQLNDVIFGNRN